MSDIGRALRQCFDASFCPYRKLSKPLRCGVLSLGSETKRREFITLLGGAAVAWPITARAQQPDRMRRLGLLMGYAENDPLSQPWITAFLQGLSELGWSDSRNLHIDYRWAGADVERIKQFAKELAALKPDVILANTTPVTAVLQRETTDIPIVFVPVSDPVGAGFVASLARPGGNITGFINFEERWEASGWSCSRRSRQRLNVRPSC